MTNNHSAVSDSAWFPAFLWKNRWWLIAAALLGGIIAFIATLFMPEKYESSAVVYAAGASESDRLEMKKGNTLLLLQFLESSYLRDSVIRRYNLGEHYGIDTTTQQGKQALQQEYASNFSFDRTLYQSVRITVKDKDPNIAAELANGIVAEANKVKRGIIKKNTREKFDAIKQEYHRKSREVDSMAIELTRYKDRTSQEAKSNLEDRLKKKTNQIQMLRGELKKLRNRFQVYNLSEHLSQLRELFSTAKSEYNYQKGRLSDLRDKKSSRDSSIISAQARVKGLEVQLKDLQSQLKEISLQVDRYEALNHELTQLLALQSNLKNRIAKFSNTFEPGVTSVAMTTLEKKYDAGLERLKHLRKQYEQARAAYQHPSPIAYMVSKATPNYDAAYPRRLLITAAGAVLMFVFVLGGLLVRKPDSKGE